MIRYLNIQIPPIFTLHNLTPGGGWRGELFWVVNATLSTGGPRHSLALNSTLEMAGKSKIALYFLKISASMALVDIGLDLQIEVCTFLHPSDILTLRKVCLLFLFR